MSIGSFILRRLGSGALSVLGVSILVFLFLHMIPGDPVDNLLGPEATAGDREKLEKCMGLDQSLPEQFVTFLGHVADGTLGPQCRTTDTGDKRTVAQMRFAVRKRRGREVFALLRARVGEVQRAATPPVATASGSSGTAAA